MTQSQTDDAILGCLVLANVDPKRWRRLEMHLLKRPTDDGHGKHHIQKGMESTGTCYFLVDNMASYYMSAHMLLIYKVEW